ncbi:MAG: hypothetical protein ACRED8_00475 [Caulobacteraceae bacterium]
MAEILMGIGTSHSPMLLMEPPAWRVRGETDDRVRNNLIDFDGAVISYDRLLAKTPETMAEQISDARIEARHTANQRAIARVGEILNEVDPDLVIIFGDDHKEVFLDDNMPALSIYWGDTIPYKPQGIMKWPYDPKLKPEYWYWQDEREYPVAGAFANRLIGDLVEDGFDIGHSQHYRPGQGMSHAFGYVYRRVMTDKIFPIIPISVNTYFPPNQVPPRRAYRLGRAIRKAVEAWSEPLRIVIMGTGGLSHFVVDEALDKQFLEVLASGEEARHASLPIEKLQSGNSELRCWTAVAGAVDHMTMDVIDYVPCYRSPAGTGCGMAFATWS